MSDTTSNWKQTFSELFHTSVAKYKKGHEKASGLVTSGDAAFLGSIGYTEQEFFDFVEDFAKAGDPSLDTALNIAAVRRDYFLQEQKGVPSSRRISMEELPPKDAEIDGIPWLPRLIVKAEVKLRGEMPPDLMYGCGGDRKFFRNNKIDPADFLRKIWQTPGNKADIVAWVKTGVR